MRRAFLFLTLSATLTSSALYAFPRQTGGTGGRATAVRTKCPRPSCGVSGDSATRAKQEQLFYKIDSLRWQFENTRLSAAERERIGTDLERTVLALQESIDQTMRTEVTFERMGPTPRSPSAMAGSKVAIAMPPGCRTPGYLGVTFDGLNGDDCINNERVVRFFEYPRVALVARSSPAERAGIVIGDTVVAFNGADVTREAISFTKLLVPESRLIVRVRRDGDAKDLAVTVGEAPAYYVLRSTPMPAMPPRAPSAVMTPERVRVQAAQPAPPAPATGFSMVWSSSDGVAGARVETISEGLGKTVGVKQGVLVLSADPGTPAYRSGLRDGDVILKADGRNVATVRGLLSVLARSGSGDDGVKLVVLRERKQKDVSLRW
ncbi:MAG: PDZ domain-containing protein [Gemmatimonadaceae bacterium]